MHAYFNDAHTNLQPFWSAGISTNCHTPVFKSNLYSVEADKDRARAMLSGTKEPDRHKSNSFLPVVVPPKMYKQSL